MRLCGIYQIKNLTNGKTYIGSSNNINRRWNDHKRYLRKGSHTNPRLQLSWNRHGEECFEFSILEVCEEETLRDIEQEYISTFNPFYNIALVVGMPNTPKAGTPEAIEQNRRGYNARLAGMHTEECKKLTSDASKRKWQNPEYAESRSKDTLKLWNNEEYRLKQKKAHRKLDESDRELIRSMKIPGQSNDSLAEMFGVSKGTIRRIYLGLH